MVMEWLSGGWVQFVVWFGVIIFIGTKIDKDRAKDRADMQAKIDRLEAEIKGDEALADLAFRDWGQEQWDEYHSKGRQYEQVPDFFKYVHENQQKAEDELCAHRELLRLLGARGYRNGSYHYIDGDIRQDLIRHDEKALKVLVDTYWREVVDFVIKNGIPDSSGWPRKDDIEAGRIACDIFNAARVEQFKIAEDKEKEWDELCRSIREENME